MRHTGDVLCTLFLLTAATAASAGTFTVDVEQPRIRLTQRTELRVQCRTDKSIDGCAEFLGEVLNTHCDRDEDNTWRITATARLIPYLYVTSPAVVAHERLHVEDISKQLETFLAALTARSFTDETVCRADADFEAAVFALRMDVFRVESNQRLH
jgi:hypothetical protein